MKVLPSIQVKSKYLLYDRTFNFLQQVETMWLYKTFLLRFKIRYLPDGMRFQSIIWRTK